METQLLMLSLQNVSSQDTFETRSSSFGEENKSQNMDFSVISRTDIPGVNSSKDFPQLTHLIWFSFPFQISDVILSLFLWFQFTNMMWIPQNTFLIKQYAYRKLPHISPNQPVSIYLKVYI